MPAALLLLAAGLASAQAPFGAAGEEGGLTAYGPRGLVTVVNNLFDGQNHSIQVSRLDVRGGLLWTVRHGKNYFQKAHLAATDPKAQLYVAGVRRVSGGLDSVLLKLTDYGAVLFESYDAWGDCAAAGLAADPAGGAWVASVCKTGEQYPVRLARFDDYGGLLWAQNWDGGGRNYVRGLTLDARGDASMVVETVYGNYRDGTYRTSTVVYDKHGTVVGVRR